jgi:hypothetical protein
MKAAGGEHGIKPERRMKCLLYLVLLEPIGLFAFAWTSLGPPEVAWIAPLIFVAMIGTANLAIYQATCDYMVSPAPPPPLNQASITNSHPRSPPTANTPPLPPAATASAATSWPASPRSTPPPSTPRSSPAPSGSSRSPASSSPPPRSRSSSPPTSSTSTANGSATAPRTPAILPRSAPRTWLLPRRCRLPLRKRMER